MAKTSRFGASDSLHKSVLASASNRVAAEDLGSDALLATLTRDADGRPLVGGIPLIAKLGQGAMGVVYYGVHPRLNSEVAIKILPFHLVDQNETLIQRFINEAQVAAKIKSQNLVGVIDVNEEKNIYYLVMEYVHGLSAADILRDLQNGRSVPPISNPIPVNDPAAETPLAGLPVWAAMEIVISATIGLAAAHQHDVIHRDVKPDNILVPRTISKEDEAPLDLGGSKLADLGLAKPTEQVHLGTVSQSVLGTPGYMAPEQISDQKQVSKRSDVFAMGVTLYTLLKGAIPFKGSGFVDVMVSTLYKDHTPIKAFRSDIPDVINDVIERCLKKNPDERHQDAEELLDNLYEAYRSGLQSALLESEGSSRRIKTAALRRVSARRSPIVPSGESAADELLEEPVVDDGGVVKPGTKAGVSSSVELPQSSVAMPQSSPSEPRSEIAADSAPLTPSAPPAPSAPSAPNRGIIALALAAIIIASVAFLFLFISSSGGNELLQSAKRLMERANGMENREEARQLYGIALKDLDAALSDNENHPIALSDRESIRLRIGQIDRYLTAVENAEASVAQAQSTKDANQALDILRSASASFETALSEFPGDLRAVRGATELERLIVEKTKEIETRRDQTRAAHLAEMREARRRAEAAKSAPDYQSASEEWAAAQDAYRKALDFHPESSDAKIELAEAQATVLELGHVARLYQRAQSDFDGSRSARTLAERTASLNAAMTSIETALAMRPNDSAALALKNAIVASQRDISNYETAMRRGQETERELAAETSTGALHRLLTDAETLYQEALRCLPEDADADASLKRIRQRLSGIHPYIEAMESGRQAEQRAERSRKVSDWQAALTSYRHALDVIPNDPDALTAIAIASRWARRDFYAQFVALRRLQGHESRISFLGMSPTGRYILTTSWDRSARIWEISSGQQQHRFDKQNGVVWTGAISPDGRKALTASADGSVIVWDALRGDNLFSLAGQTGLVKHASFSGNGRFIATAGRRTLHIHDAFNGRELHAFQTAGIEIHRVAFSPNGETVMAASDRPSVEIWDIETGNIIHRFNELSGRIIQAEYAADGTRLFICTVVEDGQSVRSDISIYNSKTGARDVAFSIPGDASVARISSDGAMLFIAFDGGAIRAFDSRTGNPLAELHGHTESINAINFSPDGALIVTASDDNSARIWDVGAGKQIAVLIDHKNTVAFAVFTPDGQSIVTASQDLVVRVWGIPQQSEE